MNSIGTILRQDSIGKERTFSRNGVQQDVHIVAKNLPFLFEISFPMPMNKCKFATALFYDGEDLMNLKPVDTVTKEPMTSKIFVHELGEAATVECRINVLTSQHEEAHFRVRINATLITDPSVSMDVLSEPIWTVSKPAQANKILQKKRISPSIPSIPSKEQVPMVPLPQTLPSSPSLPTISGMKRNSNDLVLEALERLERKQEEQQKLINHLVRKTEGPSFFLQEPIPDPNDMEFEQAFQNFVSAYSIIPLEQRSKRMRLLAHSNANHFETFMGLCSSSVRQFAPEQLACNGTCPHKKDLEAFENLYESLLSPESSNQLDFFS